MKRFFSITALLFVIICALLSSCSPTYEKSPDQYSKIKWYSPDYSFYFSTDDDCKGAYKFENTKYNVKVEFDNSRLSVKDTEKNKELFFADWMYEDSEDHLYIYNITFNTKDYKEFEGNFAEFVKMNQEKV